MQVKRTGYIVISIVALLAIGSSWPETNDAQTRSTLSQVDSLTAAGSFEDAAALIESIEDRLLPDTVLLPRKGIIYRQINDVESRRKSAHCFRKLIERYPTATPFYIELARTLIAQTFDDEAKAQLRRAVDLNPTDEVPYLLLFDIFVSRFYYNAWKSEADKAESTLQALLRQVPTSQKGLYKLASLEAVRGKLSAALKNAQRAFALDSAVVDVNLALGYIHYQLHHYEQCQRYYGKALAKMKRFDRWVYTTVECVLPPKEAEEYPYWRAEVRDSISRDFWNTRDSDPTTEINERLLEHYCRVWEANLYFGTPENGGVGWRTPLGATLVRMGRPDVRRRELKEVAWSRNRHFIDESPVWYWDYGSTEIPCSFAFLDRYMKNDYTYPIAGYDKGLSPIHQASGAVADAVFSQKPEQSSLLRSTQPIGIMSEVYQFRAAGGKTMALVDMTIPVKDVAFDTVSGRAKAVFAVRRALRLPNQELVWQRAGEEKLDMAINEAVQDSGVWRDLFVVEANPGVYQLALACEQSRVDRLGLSKSSIKFQRYDSAVAISDLLVTTASITDPKLGDIWRRNDSNKIFPQRTLSLSKPVTVYFEIYNLPTDIFSQTRLQVSYNLQLAGGSQSGLKGLLTKLTRGKRESITVTYRESSRNRDLVRATVIDVSLLRAGNYTLTVEVTDQVFNRTVSKTTTLTLTP
jgi:GWxTD domain-containing protein